jgi:membrane-bound serine protease (ClpP class)
MTRRILLAFAFLAPALFSARAEEILPAEGSPSATPAAEPAAPAPEAPKAAEAPAPTWHHPSVALPGDGVADIFVIPIEDEIGKTNLYVLRRGLKKAISSGAEVVVLEMDTPGGRADIMLEMMEAVDNFHGRTIAFVKKEAMSAGALICASAQEIYFAPKSVIGAAAVIQGNGEDIPHTLKTKIDSYMDAKLRAVTAENPRRADVLRAMMQEDYVLEIGGVKIKDKGSLLSRTADEAMALYGEPPSPLLGAGIFSSVEDLAKAQYGEGRFAIHRYEMTWSETAAMYMEKVAPVLMGIGFLCLVVEFYTPGFGLPGIAGITLLVIVFLGNYIAGLAGNEPLLVFGLGLLLVLLELFLLPGIMVLAITGVILMVGSLIWSLGDVWPKTGGGFEFNGDRIMSATFQVLLAVFGAMALFAILYRFLPKRLFLAHLVLEGASGNAPAAQPVTEPVAPAADPLPGTAGRAVTDLRPSGTVVIGGVQYEASLTVGFAQSGQPVTVVGRKDFHLLVKLG